MLKFLTKPEISYLELIAITLCAMFAPNFWVGAGVVAAACISAEVLRSRGFTRRLWVVRGPGAEGLYVPTRDGTGRTSARKFAYEYDDIKEAERVADKLGWKVVRA